MITPIDIEDIWTLREWHAACRGIHDRTVDPENIAIVWDDTMTADNGIMGSFSPLRTTEIHLAAFMRPVLDHAFPILAHELHHAWQHRKYGLLLYSFLACPFWRRITIEPTAQETKQLSEHWITQHLS